MIIEIESTWWLLMGCHCNCDKELPYTLTTDGHHWAQCPGCLAVYQCGCASPELQLLSEADGILVCWNCGMVAQKDES